MSQLRSSYRDRVVASGILPVDATKRRIQVASDGYRAHMAGIRLHPQASGDFVLGWELARRDRAREDSG